MATLGPPRGPLQGFPARVLPSGTVLARIHLSSHGPWWFSNDGTGRFDLRAGERGTCYLAERPTGAFVEVFREIPLVDEADVAARVLSLVALPRRLRLADATSSRARAFGVTGALHTTDDFEVTGAWASAFAAAGFEGVRYLCGHDPALEEAAVALFGPGGEPGDDAGWPPPSKTGPVPPKVLAEVERTFGVVVLPVLGT